MSEQSTKSSRGRKASGDGPTVVRLEDLQTESYAELVEQAEDLEINEPAGRTRKELILDVLKAWARRNKDADEPVADLRARGVLEVVSDGYGFLRSPLYDYTASDDDVYVSPGTVRALELRTGMELEGPIRPPRSKENYFSLVEATTVDGEDPESAKDVKEFDQLTPLYPDERLILETEPDIMETRVIDLIAPFGKGQRMLIVAPPRAGKTVLLKKISQGLTANHPALHQLVLLIDERPEEVTDMRRTTGVEVIASTFDETPKRHIQVTEMVLERAKRLVERGKDVLILLDSITRLGRAYNNATPGSGRLLSGGVDVAALKGPRNFFGSARNVEEGGSLTIIATALIDTGSQMDQVIFEEFKGTGNCEIVLDRDMQEMRVWPAIDITRSGTRKEELLCEKEELRRMWVVRKEVGDLTPVDAMEIVREKLSKYDNNAEFLLSVK